MFRPFMLTLLTLTCPLSLLAACEEPAEFGDPPEGVDPDATPSFRCEPVWDCVGGGQTPNSGGHTFNNVPYRPTYFGAINWTFRTSSGASVLRLDSGSCLHDGELKQMLSWRLDPDGEIRVLLRFTTALGLNEDLWKGGDYITDNLCTWNFSVWDYDEEAYVATRMRFTDHRLETVNEQTAHTYVMWTDVEPDVDGAFYSDGFYTACFEDKDYRVVGVARHFKDARKGVSSFTAAGHEGVFECVHRSPIGEALDHMGMHLSDMNTASELMAVQNMMQGAGDRGYPTPNFDTYIAPVCDSGAHTTAPPSTTHELEACWGPNGAICKGEDYRIENDSFPASIESKPACTPALMDAAYCCSYVLQ